MKVIDMKDFTYLYIAAAITVLTACDSNLEKVHYDESLSVAAQLAPLAPAYVLDPQNSDGTAIEFRWAPPQINYPASITTDLQMDLEVNGFKDALTLASTKTDSTYTITVGDLNAAIMRLLANSGKEVAALLVSFRLVSTLSSDVAPLVSNVVTTSITPYAGEREYPQLWVIGDYCGWNHASSQYLYSAKEDDNYAAMIYFDGKAQNGWKLTPEANWNSDWGGEGTLPAEASTLILVPSGENLTNYSKTSYYVEFNTATATLKMSQGHDSWGIVGAFNNWGDMPDTVMTLASESESGKRQYYLTATLALKAGEGWKIRPDNEWTDDRGPSNLKYEGVSASDGNFVVSEDGTYTIRWYFNKVEERLSVTKE